MMGYVKAETEACDEWMLVDFRSCYGIAPKFFFLDQEKQAINAKRKALPNSILPESIHLLDQYYLNKNQLANCNALAGGNGAETNKQRH